MPGETDNRGTHNFPQVSSLEESDLQNAKSRSPDTENLLPVSDMDPMATSSTKAKLSSDSTGEPELVPLKKIRNAKTRSPDMVPMATTSTQPKASSDSTGEPEPVPLKKGYGAQSLD